MSDDTEFEITIPTDNDGYVLLQCGHCGELFKLLPAEMEDDSVVDICCPGCGLISANYLTEDVINLMMVKVQNYVTETFFDQVKKMERQTQNANVKIKAGKKPQRQEEEPIRASIDALRITRFPCCHRTAKISPLLRMSACCCPYCGVKNYEFE